MTSDRPSTTEDFRGVPAAPVAVGPGAPTAPIAITGGASAATSHVDTAPVSLPDGFVERLGGACASVTVTPAECADASRDWWPLAMIWATNGEVPALAGAVVWPSDAGEVAAILQICNEARVPVTAAGGRSGVCGSSIPLHGGVILDTGAMAGITDVDEASGLVDVLPGTFGDHFEADLRAGHGQTVGHWPQSMALSTVGGWVACRGAGQYSNRYGKIEDLVAGLDIVLADGTSLSTGTAAKSAVGPDLNQVFIGSEGTLGIVTGVRLRSRPIPPVERRGAWLFESFADGLEACRTTLRRGATPAVLRLYDGPEGQRNFGTGDAHVLIALDEAEGAIVDATFSILEKACAAAGGESTDAAHVETWMGHRNDVSALEALIGKGFVVDTMEVAGPWSSLPTMYDQATAAIAAVPGALAATAHQSHAYVDGACLYFTFAGRPDADQRDEFYRACWDAGTQAVLGLGGALSHHHGVGVNRGRFMEQALGTGGHRVLRSIKDALDPNGILNPGKLGLPSPFGDDPAWP